MLRFLNRLKQVRFQDIIKSLLVFDLNRDATKTIIVAGEGRSGSSWLAEMINWKHDMRSMFEPFHPGFSNLWQVMKTKYKTYLSETSTDPVLAQAIQKVLTGQLRSPRIDRYNRTFFLPKKRIIKLIHANLWLKWIRKHYPSTPIVLILRNPLAIAASRTFFAKADWLKPSSFYDEQELCDVYLKPFRYYVDEKLQEFERSVLSVSIVYYVLLKELKEADNILLTSYEMLQVDFEKEMKKIWKYLSFEWDDAILDLKNKKSHTTGVRWTKGYSSFQSPQGPLTYWKTQVTKEQIESGLKIMRAFGLDTIYSDQELPNMQAVYDRIKAGSQRKS